MTLRNWASPPYNRWAFRNVGILPSVMVPRNGAVRPLAKGKDPGIEGLRFDYQGESFEVGQSLADELTDGYLVWHDGEVVYERYFDGFDAHDHHLWASSTKSLVAMALGLLVGEGHVDPAAFPPSISRRVGNVQVFSKPWVADTLAVTDADREAASRSIFHDSAHAAYLQDLEAYRNYWWILDADRGELTALGVFGQFIYVNLDARVVVASFASATSPSNVRRATFKRKLRATRAIANWLAAGRQSK